MTTTVLPKKAIVTPSGWTINYVQEEDYSNHYYSNSWHRAYGPKITVSNRMVVLTRKYGRGTQRKECPVETWAGDCLARAVNELGLGPKKKYPRKLALNKAYTVDKLRQRHGYIIYERKILGAHQDYVVKAPDGTVYHCPKEKDLIAGVHNKIRGKCRRDAGLIDKALCVELGFCLAGIETFCELFNLDMEGSYTPEEIESVVRKKPDEVRPFLSELQTLANATNYTIGETT